MVVVLPQDGEDMDKQVLKRIGNLSGWNKPDSENYIMAMYTPKILKYATCLREYTKITPFAAGAYGMACYVSTPQQPELYVVKIQRIKYPEQYAYEIETMRRFYQAGLTVKIISECKVSMEGIEHEIGVIVMEKLHGTVSELLHKYGPVMTQSTIASLWQQYMAILDTMKRCHLSHNDMHMSNVGYVVEGGNHVLKLIDFGRGSCQQYMEDLNKLSFLVSIFKPKREEKYGRLKVMITPYLKDFLKHIDSSTFFNSKTNKIDWEKMHQRFKQLIHGYLRYELPKEAKKQFLLGKS
jgi:serine/threonine protein kinase